MIPSGGLELRLVENGKVIETWTPTDDPELFEEVSEHLDTNTASWKKINQALSGGFEDV